MTRTAFTLVVLTLTAGLAAAAPKGYPFAVAPDKTFDVLAGLDAVSGQKSAPTADEAALFADAADGKLDQFSFADACLIASGVTDPAGRKKYLARLDQIEADARKALAGAATPAEQGERLLKFLHAGPMAKGYKGHQTDLHTVLDTGTFNCVSSAALYNVIGRRLGLDLRAVEIPQHVFAVLYDGDKRIDVETTNKAGFDPSDKGPSAKKVTKAERHSGKRREIGEAGLAAVIAYNHGVTLAKEKRFHEATLANVRALALDPANPSAAQNAVADLTNWSLALSKAGKHGDALEVLKCGSRLDPKDGKFKNNTRAVYDAWAKTHMKDKDWAGAIKVYEGGLKDLPGDRHLKNNLAYCQQEQGRSGKDR
jgi:tetratricopeptide (TPR) repeat protein